MYILFDIGATNMRFARSDDLTQFDSPVIVPTPVDFNEAMSVARGLIEELSEDEDIEGIAGGIAGVLDSHKSKLLRSPNLTSWEGKPLKESLMDMTGTEPRICNDADMGGLGEAVYGAGKGSKICAYMTVSTGIGGSLIIDGEVMKTHLGSEPGFQIIDYKNNTTLHEIISGRSIEERLGKKAKDIDDPQLWDDVEPVLAVGIHNTIIHWSPDTFVLGGSIMKDLDIPDIENALKRRMTIFPELPRFVRAELGSKNGLYGAMAHLKRSLEK